jgi:hypothetical protein
MCELCELCLRVRVGAKIRLGFEQGEPTLPIIEREQEWNYLKHFPVMTNLHLFVHAHICECIRTYMCVLKHPPCI